MTSYADLAKQLRDRAQARHDQEHLCYADGGIESDAPLEEYPEWIAASALESLSAENAALKEKLDEWKRAASVEASLRREFKADADRLLQQRNEAFERAAKVAEEQYASPGWNSFMRCAGNAIAESIRQFSKES